MVASRLETKSKFKRPPAMEFSKETIVAALQRAEYKCEECGKKKKDTPEGYFEIHHKLPIYIACKYFPYIAARFIASLMNTEVLCCACHRKRHTGEHWHEYEDHAEQLVKASKIDAKALLGSGGRRRV